MSQGYNYKAPKDNKLIVGIIVVLIGVAFLLKSIMPSWIFSWHMVMVVLGIYIGSKNQFKSWVSWALIGFGLFCIINNNVLNLNFLRPTLFPAVIIAIGLGIIFRSRNKKDDIPPTHPYQVPPFGAPVSDTNVDLTHTPLLTSEVKDKDGYKQDNFHEQVAQESSADEDYVVLSTYLGGNNRVVTSKRFKGAKLTCIMGGLEVDLHNADFNGTVIIDVFCAFGGLEIRVPSNWYVRNEVTPIIGGMEDNRRNLITHSQDKVVIIRGTVLFGGIELKS